jgi:putative selenate reductase molybdopterin-binding subunit
MTETVRAVERPGAGLVGRRREAGRLDAERKATGQAIYVGDIERPGMLHVAVARSSVSHARIVSIDTSAALASPGVFAVYTADDVTATPYGRAVRDIPVLARGVVRYVGEQVAAVLATTRRQAEQAAALIDISYDELPAVTDPVAALAPGAPLVHAEPWKFAKAAVKEDTGANLQSLVIVGEREACEATLAASAHVIDRTYTTPAGHQGYIEPWACVAEVEPSGKAHIWLTNKSPYRLREQIASCVGVDEEMIEIEPITLGGDFGGKGSPEQAPLCIELSRLSGRPVKHVLRYSEDLTATNPRHPSTFRVRLGCDDQGRLTALASDVVLDGGAYAGFKPAPTASIHGVLEAPGYRLPVFFAEARITYTNTVPKGHMRAPGAPQQSFATESAMDELALEIGMDPVEFRRINMLQNGDDNPNGHPWVEYRGLEALEAALAAYRPQSAPKGWLLGMGISIYSRETSTSTATSLCLVPLPSGKIRVEIPIVETGTGSHTVVRELIGRELGYEADEIEVVQVSTDDLSQDPGAGGSRVTASIAMAVDQAVKAWRERLDHGPVSVVVNEAGGPPIGSYSVQMAQVAVDPETGETRVLEILSAIDVAEIINPVAHQMQVDGGSTQGFGFACLEDLDESEGQVWAANLGEFKIPSARDVPAYRTILVPGGRGVGTANVKNIGESTNPPTAAAIANAIANATGVRVRDLPLRAERVYRAMKESSS